MWNRSVADFEELCDRLPGCSTSELCILQPVLYMYLDPDRIPAKPNPAATTDIELVYWSLLAIVVTLGRIDGFGADSPAESEQRYLISSWNRVTPWLVFFHDQFIMCRANYRPVDRTSVIKLVTSLLFHVSVVGGNRGETTGLPITPILYRPIAELWLLALKTKDKDVVCLSVQSGAHIASFRVFGSFLVAECIRNESFVTILLEVSGGIDTVTSTALNSSCLYQCFRAVLELLQQRACIMLRCGKHTSSSGPSKRFSRLSVFSSLFPQAEGAWCRPSPQVFRTSSFSLNMPTTLSQRSIKPFAHMPLKQWYT